MREVGTRSRFITFFAGLDYLQFGVMLLLLGIGLTFIYSTGEQVDTESSRAFFGKQLHWIGLGIFLYFLMAAIDYRALPVRFAAFGGYGITIIALILVLFLGRTISGATRWLDIGGFRLQPSEPAKLAIICVLANIFSDPRFSKSPLKIAVLTAMTVGVPFALIAIEPDLGSALILLPVTGAMLFCFGIKWRYILTILLAVCCCIAVVLADCFVWEKPLLLRSYQIDRIKIFMNPGMDKQGRGLNAYQAMNSVGSGGLSGKGIGKGTQNELGFLPQTVSNNDFIFSVLAEETGFTGSLFLLALYMTLLYTILRTAFLTGGYGRFLATGIGTMFFCHIFINIGMNIGVAPITGLPLPLLSYGGSFTLTGMGTLGMLQSIYRSRDELIS